MNRIGTDGLTRFEPRGYHFTSDEEDAVRMAECFNAGRKAGFLEARESFFLGVLFTCGVGICVATIAALLRL